MNLEMGRKGFIEEPLGEVKKLRGVPEGRRAAVEWKERSSVKQRRGGAQSEWLMGRGNSRREKGEKKRGGGWGRLQRGNSSEMSCRQRVEYRGKTQEAESERENREGGD